MILFADVKGLGGRTSTNEASVSLGKWRATCVPRYRVKAKFLGLPTYKYIGFTFQLAFPFPKKSLHCKSFSGALILIYSSHKI